MALPLLPCDRSSRIASLLSLSAALLSLLPASRAAGQEIFFDELESANENCCYLSDEYYEEFGVLFETTDDGSVWDGTAAGDPGEWRLDGTAGQAFLGFNGTSYEATVHFDEPVVGFAMDAARGYGSSGFAELRLWGMRNGEIVERFKTPLGAVNQWVTATLASEVDAVRWKVLGDSGMRPYGVDHLSWEPVAPPEPEVAEVVIDVLPFRRHNVMPASRRGVLPTLLYGSETFAVEDVDPESLAFGPAGARALGRWFGPHQFDKNRDGLFDMLFFVRSGDAGLELGRGEVCVEGHTWDGLAFVGCDELEIVEPRRRGRGHKHGHDRER